MGTKLGRGFRLRRRGAAFAGAVVGTLGLIAAAPGAGGGIAVASIAVNNRGPATTVTTTDMVTVAHAPRVPAGAKEIGTLAASRTLRGVVALNPRNPAELAKFAKAISTPGNADYRRYVSAKTFETYFSPTTASVAGVEATLRSAGLRTSTSGSDRLLVSWNGRASAVAAAFHTSFVAYQLPSGRHAFTNTSEVRLPASVAPLVTGVVGLNDLTAPQTTPFRPVTKKRGTAAEQAKALERADAAKATTGGPAACRAARMTASYEEGLTDTEIADAYGVNGLYAAGARGAGQTVAVYELEPYRTVDIKAFDDCYFGATAAAKMLTRLKTVAVDGGIPTGPGSAESELDVDDVSALAPDANIDVYEAPASNAGYLDEWAQIVSNDTAKTVTSSWGSGCETEVATDEPGLEQAENTIFEQAAIQGQTILDASGDEGSDGCAYDTIVPVSPDLSVDDPASQPYVTAVGGTTMDDPADPPTEQVWNDGADGGGSGGGISAMWPQPSWQAHSTVAGIDNKTVISKAETQSGTDFCQNASVSSECREVPDVSANADELTGITIVYDGEWGTIGGTSSSTPLWAAMLADADSTAACTKYGGVGFASPSLYGIASIPAEYKASFNDISGGDNDVFGASTGLYPATKGYDMATGLGTPKLTGAGDARGLAYYLCTPPVAARPSVTSISPDIVSSAAGSGTGTAGGTVTLTVHGTHFESNGAPDVAGVTIGSYQVTPFTVVSNTELTLSAPVGAVQEGNGSTGTGAGVYDVSVTLIGGQTSLPTANGRLTVTADPTGSGASDPVVEAVTPSGGNLKGGTTIHIYGSGFTADGATSTVTIGGQTATVTSATNTVLTVTAPAYDSGSTTCASFDANPTTDVCQTQVVVTNNSGSSPTATILPEYSGPIGVASLGGDEDVAAATEFDYFPTPTVTSYSFDDSGQHYASEEGFSYVTGAPNEVTITGTGLGLLGFEWADVGTPGTANSQDAEVVSINSTSVDLYLPFTRLTRTPYNAPLAIQTLGSSNTSYTSTQEPSNTIPVAYAPVPSKVSIKTSTGKPYAPDGGGTRVSVTGSGFYDDFFAVLADYDWGTISTQYNVDPSSSAPHNAFTFVTTQTLPGLNGVWACTESGCSGDQLVCEGGECLINIGQLNVHNELTTYPPGRPRLTSSTPKKGRAFTEVTVQGQNLNLVENVYLGTHKVPLYNFFTMPNPKTGVQELLFIVPRGLKVGHTYDIRLTTAESLGTQRNPLTPINKRVTFTLTHASRSGRGVDRVVNLG